jgi:hypothetical protein
MNFGKLLGVGKSFFGSGAAAEYRLHKRTSLPKFNEGRNPFGSRPASAPAQAPVAAALVAMMPAPTTVAAIAPVVQVPKLEKPVSKSSGLTIAQAVAVAQKAKVQTTTPPYAFKPMPKAPMQPAAKVAINSPAAQPAARPAKTGWTTRLNPFRPPEPVVEPVARQAELSLDAVKVVHNDLADADVEIVPVKSRAETVAAPVLPPARHVWEYLGENLLKSS